MEWVKAEIVDNCEACQASFGIFRRKHHCRYCGHVFCDSCTPSSMKLPPQFGYTDPQVCRCLLESVLIYIIFSVCKRIFCSASATLASPRCRQQTPVEWTSSASTFKFG